MGRFGMSMISYRNIKRGISSEMPQRVVAASSSGSTDSSAGLISRVMDDSRF